MAAAAPALAALVTLTSKVHVALRPCVRRIRATQARPPRSGGVAGTTQASSGSVTNNRPWMPSGGRAGPKSAGSCVMA